MTARRRVEKELRELNETLDQRVLQRTEALKEADYRKDEFLAMLAHELRNPMAAIMNGVQLLRLKGSKEPVVERGGRMIERQVKHLVRLVDDLLDMSRVASGKIHLQKGALDLAAVARQAIEMSQPFIDARGHEVIVTLPSDPVGVEGDFARLTQVLNNLLINAAKYTEKGGRIWLTVERASGGADGPVEAVARVRDTGRGIDLPALKDLFALFYQADRAIDRTDGGLGVGLSLVKGLVEMHGGRVEAHSAGRGMGSEFIVRLPLQEEAPPVAADSPRAPTPEVRPTRILVVDDNVDSAESMAGLLECEGHEVLLAHDGQKAVEIALRERPGAVLLDIGLPVLDGLEACRAMRAGGLTDTLIVAMTGYGQEEDRRKSRDAGFDAHHVKPVDMQPIRELLAQWAARARAGG